jgi:hypothetical protein
MTLPTVPLQPLRIAHQKPHAQERKAEPPGTVWSYAGCLFTCTWLVISIAVKRYPHSIGEICSTTREFMTRR